MNVIGFGGHLHIVLNPPKQIPIFINGQQTNRHTVLVHSGAFAKTFGQPIQQFEKEVLTYLRGLGE